MSASKCAVHNDQEHAPVLCHTEKVWHHYVCKPKPRESAATINYGTHTLPERFWTRRPE